VVLILVMLAGSSAEAAAPVAITGPADGSQHQARYTGPLAVDFTGGDLGDYTLAVTGPAGYSWQTVWNYDGSQLTNSWSFSQAVHAGKYTATATAPDATIAATASFSIAPSVLGSSAAPSPFYPFERDRFRDSVRFYFRTNFAAHDTVRVVNSLGRVIRIKHIGVLAAETLHGWSWKGRKDDGQLVSPGRFYLHLVAVAGGHKVRGPAVLVRARPIAPRILHIAVSPSPFYPIERDGYRDHTTVSYATNVRASDTIRVRAPNGRIIRIVRLGTLKGHGHNHTWQWNGTNNAGALVSTGTYRVKVVSVYYGQKVVSPWRNVVLKKKASSGGGNCTPGYSPCLVYHGGADYDCYGGSGNGPYYTAPGVVYSVTGSDPYGLDANGNGLGCE
jgi:flagellar hook assembly protein FlgD